MRRPSKLKTPRLRGFTLVELGIAVVLSAMLTSGLLLAASDFLQGQTAEAKGFALSAINQAVNSYEAKYATQLASNQPIAIPGYANVVNIYSPTLAELFELELLPNSTPQGNYGIRIGSTLVGGVPSGLVWITTPFLNHSGEVDLSLAGTAMTAAGGDAGISTTSNPAAIQGVDGWTAANPQTGTAGIVAMRNGAGSGAYVRLDGSTPMQGSLNFNNHDLTGVNNLGATTVNSTSVSATTMGTSSLAATSINTTSLSASTINATSLSTSTLNAGSTTTGSLTVTGSNVFFGSSQFYSDGWNTVIRQNGTLYVQNYSGGASSLDAGRVTAEEYLQVDGQATAGAGCSPNGLIAQNGQGKPLFCENGVWVDGSSAAPLGTACGLVTNAGTDGSLCQGYNAYYSCPPGYFRVHWSLPYFGSNGELAFCTQQTVTGGNEGS